jgi:hypothetical protein
MHNQPLNSVTTHRRRGKKVRILSQLREHGPPIGDASRTLPSSGGLFEVLPIYQLLVDYIGSKICCMNNGFDIQISCKAIYTGSEYAITVAYEALSMQCRTHGCRYYSER